MRILHIDTEAGFRGGEQQVMLLMEGLRSRGIAQGLLARTGGELARRARAAGFSVHDWAPASPLHPLAGRRLRQALAAGGYDLVHAHTAHAHTIAWRGARGRQPVVVTRRVDFPVAGNALSRRKYTDPGIRFIAISRGVAEVLQSGGVPGDRIVIVPSGVDPARFRSATGRPRVRSEWNVQEPGPVIGTVGSYVDHKDPLNLVHAAAHLARDTAFASSRFVLVGEGELRPAIEDAVARLGLGGRVILTGWRADVGDCLAGFDAFVMPSKLEGLSTSLLDAQAAGLPCVACRTGGIPDVIQDGMNGLLVPPGDPPALADAIARLWRDEPLRNRLAQAGPRVVEERFTVDRMVEGSLGVYRQLIRGNR